MDKFAEIRVPIAHNNPSIKRKENRCVLCGKCKDVCKKQMGVAGYWNYDSEDIICINCGQCANFCPVDAIVEQNDTNLLLQAISNPNKKVAVITSPAVRVSLGEMFGLTAGEFVAGKMVSAIKNLGVDYVFDVAFGADFTVMEEATEFINRIKNNESLPQFTSCCPAWVKFVKTFYPQYKQNLSTCKSPIAMLASVIKNWFAKSLNMNPSDMVVVALTPCVAKKMEAKQETLHSEYGFDTNFVVTVREMGTLLEQQKIDFNNCEISSFDEPFDQASGSGVMFGASGGVTQAVVRTAYYLTTHKSPPHELMDFKGLRGCEGVKTAKINLLGKELHLCVVSGTANARLVLDKLSKQHFDLIEVMACPNGCVGGGGQPKQSNNDYAITLRGDNLFVQDKGMTNRCSYQNKQLQQIYKEFLGKPASKKAKQYLHISH